MQSSLSLKQPERKVPDVENPDIQMLLTRDSDGSKCNSNYPYPCSTDHFAWNSVIDCKFGWTGFKFPGYGLWGYLCLCFNPLLGEIMFLIARLSVITGVRFRSGVHVSPPFTQPSNPAPIGSLDLPAYMKRCAVAAVFRPRILWLIAKHTRLSRWPDLPGRHQRFLESSCRPEDFRNHQIPWLDYSYSWALDTQTTHHANHALLQMPQMSQINWILSNLMTNPMILVCLDKRIQDIFITRTLKGCS